MIVVLDACVLYPPSLRDLLLTLAALDAFDIRWSEPILDEVARNVLADNPDIYPARFARHTLGAMRAAFPEAMTAVKPAVVENLDNDPKDRHVAAVAITANANGLVTLNTRDFRSRVLRTAGVAILTPGKLLEGVLDDSPEVAVLAVRHLAARWIDPPRTPRQIATDLAVHPTMGPPLRRLRTLLPADDPAR